MLTGTHQKIISRFVLGLILIGGALGALRTSPVLAATWTVTNTNNSGPGSLRQAIADAGMGDVITFAPSLSGQTITLVSMLSIDKDLTIDGSSTSQNIKLDGSSNVDVLIGINSDNALAVHLKNIDFINAGYGILHYSGILEVVNCSFIANDTGIQNDKQLQVVNSSFSQNGTGIVNFGILQVEDSTFTGNIRGIYNEKLYDLNLPGDVTIVGSMFTQNSNGGITNRNGALTVTHSVFLGNTAIYGGGIENDGSASVSNSQFINNSATQNGGGIHNGAFITVTTSTFSGNTASNNGGGITGYGGVILRDSTFFNNTAGNFGGGVIFGESFEMTNTTLDSNSATQGGGVYIDLPSYRDPSYDDSVLKNNTISKSLGGDLYINSGNVQLVNDILANSITGADCFAKSTAIVTSNHNLIENNASSPNHCGTPLVTSDPGLGPLANNGGFTETMALLSGSPAIDAGADAYCPQTDQRGVTRPQGSHCDMGAYEVGSIFADVPLSHPYYSDIEILYANGLTGGCATNPLKFCPDQIMNRGQAAVFMLRANFGSSYVPPVPLHIFHDDWSKGTWAESWAEGMKLEGLTAGCLAIPLKYCPWDQIPREQAVIFALRMKYGISYTPPPATGTLFADMTNPSYYATAWAEQAYKDGIISNCGMVNGKPKICPKDLVSRGLGAYMIVRAKNLTMP